MILKPGDRVVCIGVERQWIGILGTVEDDGNEHVTRITYDDEGSSTFIPIRFDTKSKSGEGHNIAGIIKEGEEETGWWFHSPYSEVLKKIKTVKQFKFDF